MVFDAPAQKKLRGRARLGKHLNRYVKPLRYADGVAYVPLTRGYEAVIDLEDAPAVGRFNWSAIPAKGGLVIYARRGEWTGSTTTSVLLHREILGFPPLDIDHRDDDGLNCRRSNLREATKPQNIGNARRRLGGSGFRGVHRHKGRWRAQIMVGGVLHRLGSCVSPEEAAALYAAAHAEFLGEFARTEI